MKVLRNMSPIKMEDVVIGQYRGRQGKQGYLDDKTVPSGRSVPLSSASQHLSNSSHGESGHEACFQLGIS